MFTLKLAITLVIALLSFRSQAQEYVVEVNGLVCELCSYGVAKNIRQLNFIDAEKYDEGVRVAIFDQKIFLATRENTAIDRRALFEAIEKGGYHPVSLWLIDDKGQLLAVDP